MGRILAGALRSVTATSRWWKSRWRMVYSKTASYFRRQKKGHAHIAKKDEDDHLLTAARHGEAGAGRDAPGGPHHERTDTRGPSQLHGGAGVAKNRQARKAQRTRGPTGRDEKGERSTAIESLSVRHIGIVVQSFAVFVAISTLLGRIHSLTFYKVLGIPTSEIRLNVTDYAVVSPEVTIFGVGFSLTMAVLFWYDGTEGLSVVPRWFRFLLGSICCLGGIFLPLYAVVYSSRQPDLDSVWLTIQMLASVALVSFGVAFLMSGFARNTPRSDKEIAFVKAVMPLMVMLIMGFAVWAASQFSSVMGEVDALRTWVRAPEARIELASSSDQNALGYSSEECNSDSLRCHFAVVLIGDKFIYLRPLDTESPEERLYAVPVGDITSITYVSPRSVP